MTIMTCN